METILVYRAQVSERGSEWEKEGLGEEDIHKDPHIEWLVYSCGVRSDPSHVG